VAGHLKKIGATVNELFHSGKTRARETALVLADYIWTKHGLFETDGLAPNDDPRIWLERVSGMQEDTMLVGHLPHLARLASLLLCGETGKTIITFRMGGVLCLNRSEETWSVEWMIVPDILP
jgi:phosphohistidine phosphatase